MFLPSINAMHRCQTLVVNREASVVKCMGFCELRVLLDKLTTCRLFVCRSTSCLGCLLLVIRRNAERCSCGYLLLGYRGIVHPPPDDGGIVVTLNAFIVVNSPPKKKKQKRCMGWRSRHNYDNLARCTDLTWESWQLICIQIQLLLCKQQNQNASQACELFE